ncbi:OmpA family protein [Thalassotalea ganghwensis]
MKKTPLLTSLLLMSSFSTFAAQDNIPSASDLVGKHYLGIHGFHMNTDDDRRLNELTGSELDAAKGWGGQIGYRATESVELRLSYSDISFDMKDNYLFADSSGNSVAVDALYFPTQKSFYYLAGVEKLKLNDNALSLDLGAGYRHYFNEKFAIYLEGKGHKRFKNSDFDMSGQIGIIYYFGDISTNKVKAAPTPPAKATKPQKPVQKAPEAKASKAKDSDQDGIINSNDICPNTPASDKVDDKGCTVFTKENSTMTLLVNFDNNKAIVKPEYYGDIAKAASFMKRYPHVTLTIEGHTSSVGSASYNKTLSQKRADAIVAILVDEFNVDRNRLKAVGYGEERLLDSADNEQAHRSNRRIQATVTVTKKVAVKK